MKRFKDPVVSQILRDSIPEILLDWEEEMRLKLSAAQSKNAIALLDSLPKFLALLADSLNADASEEEKEEVAREHGEDRASDLYFPLDQMIEEYNLLRLQIVSHLVKKTPLSEEIRAHIHTYLDDGIRRATEEYIRYSTQHLRTTKDQLTLALEAAKMGTWHINLDTQKVTTSESFAHIFGVDKIEGNFFEKIAHYMKPEDAEIMNKHWSEAVRERKLYVQEFEVKGPQGNTLWVESRGSVKFDVSGEPRVFSGVLVDITERKKTEEDLKKSREEFRSIFDQAPLPMCLLEGEEMRFTLTNKSYEEFVGRPVTQKLLMDVFSKKEVELFIPIIQKVLETKEPVILRDAPLRLKNPSRPLETRYIDVGYHPYLNDNKAKGVLIIVHDVTAQYLARQKILESETSFREIANVMPQIVWTALANGYLDWYNERWYEYTGAEKGIDWTDSRSGFHPDDVKPTEKRWKESWATGKPYEMHFRIRHKLTGEYRWHMARAVALKDPSGGILRWVGTTTDIQDQKNLQIKMEEEREVRERFVLTLTHDLRTPLTAAKMNAQMLSRRQNPEDVQKKLDRIISNMDRADRMIRDLLDAGRIKSGEGIPLSITDCDLSDILKETVTHLSDVHGERFSLKGQDHILGHWDGNTLVRLIENLGSNAVKYGAPHSPVTISTSLENNEAVIKVHNEGNPITGKEKELIFMPFGRTKTAVKGNQRGWGVGLTIVKGIVEGHGGKINVDSSEEEGTTFVVKIPLDARRNSGHLESVHH